MTVMAEVTPARYSWGGDEFIFIELAEEMSLQANFRAMALTITMPSPEPEMGDATARISRCAGRHRNRSVPPRARSRRCR